jgi:putative membrane protein
MPSYQLHPEVWVLVGALLGLGWYAAHVIGPKVVRDGSPIVTRRQRTWFFAAVFLLWAATTWPMHDIAEERLYFIHMVQHVLLQFVIAPMFLLATPTWLARLVVGEGRWLRRLCHPVVAGGLFNLVAIFTHWQTTVNTSVESGGFHYGVHVLVTGVALLMWMPVCGPMPDLRLSLPGQMIYLFLMSIVPTVPAAWLVLADGVVYSAYDIPERLWGISPTSDQQLAGLFMKLVAGFYLWGLIVVLFFKWAKRHEEANKAGRTLSERQLLTWDDVKDELTEPGVTPNGT